MWTQKHAPKKLDEIVGQKTGKVKKWFSNPKKPLLLHGPPGTGKTSIAQVLSEENNLDLIEINASDYRTTSEIEKRIKPAISQQSLFNKGKIILIDEIDGLTRKDRGAVSTLKKIVKNSKFPVIFTANDAYDKKLRDLRNSCELVEFKRVAPTKLKKRLEQIIEKENMEIDNITLKKISSQAGGDVRSAITNLESFSSSGSDDFGYKDRKEDIFNTMKIIFKTSRIKTAKDAMDNSSKSNDEIFWWLEQNIANEYEKPEEVAKAYGYLSKADVFTGRIYRSQNYSMMKYSIELTAAVSAAKKGKYRKFTYYKPPQRLIRYGRSKGKRAKMKNIANKLSRRLGISKKRFYSQYIPFLRIMLENKEWKEEFIENYELDKKDLKAIL